MAGDNGNLEIGLSIFGGFLTPGLESCFLLIFSIEIRGEFLHEIHTAVFFVCIYRDIHDGIEARARLSALFESIHQHRKLMPFRPPKQLS